MTNLNAISKRLRAHCKCHVETVEPRLLMSTYTVNSISDAAQTTAGVLTLRQAVAEANLNYPTVDTIVFAPSLFTRTKAQTITLTQGDIQLNGMINISGPTGATLAIDGGGYHRIFEVNSYATVQVSNLTLTDGVQLVADKAGNTCGGAIYSAGTLKMTHCTITKNQVIGTGETFYSNQQANYAGIAEGGAIYSTGSLTINGTLLTDNSVTNVAVNDDDSFPALAGASFGGAIYGTGSITLSDDNLSGNTVKGNGTNSTSGPVAGGGIYAQGLLTITSSTVSGNSITAPATGEDGYGGAASGGGVYAGSALSISNSTIDSNNALAGDSGYSEGNSGVGRGGGIYAAGAVVISNTAITHNVTSSGLSDTADDYFGNEIPAAGGGLFAAGKATLTFDKINSNSVTGGAGDPAEPHLPTAAGGGIYAGELLLNQSLVSDNTVNATFEYGVSEYRQGGLSIGGGIVTTETASVSDSTIAENSATGGNGYDELLDAEDGMPTAAGDGYGGGIYAYGQLTITTSTVADNSAVGGVGGVVEDNDEPGIAGGESDGGGIYSGASTESGQYLFVITCTIAGNQAIGGQGGDAVDAGGANTQAGSGGNAWGGGIWCLNNSLYLYESTVSRNGSIGGVGGSVSGDPGDNGTAGTGQGAGVTALSVAIDNSIVSGNTDDHIAADDLYAYFSGISLNDLIGAETFRSLDIANSIIGVDNPQLMPLGWYGGPTQTMLPLPDSPVIDAGDSDLIAPGSTDQRGDPRISGKAVDIGAVEFGNVTLTGSVFNDQYASGNFQTGDNGIPGFTVFIDLNHDGIFDAEDISTVTNSKGQYTFDGLFSGTYTVEVESQKAYRPTTKQSATVNAKANSTTDISAFGQTQDALATGSVLLGKSALTNVRVFLDLAGNGKFVPGDPSTLTNSTGLFSLNIPSPGVYKLRIVPTSNHRVSTPACGFYTLTVGKASIRSGMNFIET